MTRQGRYGDASLDGYGNADIDQPQPRQPLDTAAIAAWNAANEAARHEYDRHPTAACDADDCDRLARHGLCKWHTRLAHQKETDK